MKFRYVLPVAVLALALVFAGGMADAAIDGTVNFENSADANSSSNNENHNSNENQTNVNVDIKLDLSGLGDLDLGSTTVTVTRNRDNWSNRARIDDNAYNGAIGVNQAVIVAGQGNVVDQRSLAIYMNAQEIAIGNTESMF